MSRNLKANLSIVKIVKKCERCALLSLFVWVGMLIYDLSSVGARDHAMVTLPDAIIRTLENNSGVHVEKEKLIQSRALVTKAAGSFDWVVFGNAASSHVEDNDVSVNSSLGATKRFRSGIEITPSFENFESNKVTSQFIERSGEVANLKIRIPLWRGLGSKYAGAEEHAAKFNYSASNYLSKHNISKRIAATAIRFWECLGASKIQDILDDSEKSGRELVDLVKLLVEGGEINPVYLGEATGRYYQIKVDDSQSREVLLSARQALAVSMGEDPAITELVPLAAGDFPPLIEPKDLNNSLIQFYSREALKIRGDYRAALKRIDAQEVLLDKAQNNKKPRIDFILDSGYADVEETFLNNANPLHQSLSGPIVQGKVNIEFPLKNQIAKGEITHRLSKKKEAELRSVELANLIKAEIAEAMNQLRSSITEITLAEQSQKAYLESVTQERRKIRAGAGSVNDLIRLDEKFADARITHVRALQKYATALVKLRFATGTILNDDENELLFQTSTLTELPPVH